MTAQARRAAPARKKNPPRAAAAKRSTKQQVNKAPKAPALAARDYETVVLVLQGGGALGAYQCGVYEGLDAAGIRPDWFAGISIGAINAALLAGNAPEQRVERLREFWQRISTPALPLPPQVFDWQRQWLDALPKVSPLQSLTNSAGALPALLHGQLGFFVPRLPPPYAATPGSKSRPGATSTGSSTATATNAPATRASMRSSRGVRRRESYGRHRWSSRSAELSDTGGVSAGRSGT